MVKSGKRETAEDREACLQRETDTHLSTRSEHSQSGAQRTIPLRSRLKVRGFRCHHSLARSLTKRGDGGRDQARRNISLVLAGRRPLTGFCDWLKVGAALLPSSP